MPPLRGPQGLPGVGLNSAPPSGRLRYVANLLPCTLFDLFGHSRFGGLYGHLRYLTLRDAPVQQGRVLINRCGSMVFPYPLHLQGFLQVNNGNMINMVLHV